MKQHINKTQVYLIEVFQFVLYMISRAAMENYIKFSLVHYTRCQLRLSASNDKWKHTLNIKWITLKHTHTHSYTNACIEAMYFERFLFSSLNSRNPLEPFVNILSFRVGCSIFALTRIQWFIVLCIRRSGAAFWQ